MVKISVSLSNGKKTTGDQPHATDSALAILGSDIAFVHRICPVLFPTYSVVISRASCERIPRILLSAFSPGRCVCHYLAFLILRVFASRSLLLLRWTSSNRRRYS
jgi:hypothetical protein